MNTRLLCALLLVPLAFAAQRGTCDNAFETAFRQGADLRLEIRAGDIDVTGADEAIVRVTCVVEPAERAREINVSFTEDGKGGRLTVSDGPNERVRIRIQVPRASNLTLRSTAGDLDVTGVRGHMDVSMRAGDLTIEVGDPAMYSRAEASVTAGDINASAFNVHKGGLFRSFRQDRPDGKYRLRASLWAGDIKLK